MLLETCHLFMALLMYSQNIMRQKYNLKTRLYSRSLYFFRVYDIRIVTKSRLCYVSQQHCEVNYESYPFLSKIEKIKKKRWVIKCPVTFHASSCDVNNVCDASQSLRIIAWLEMIMQLSSKNDSSMNAAETGRFARGEVAWM